MLAEVLAVLDKYGTESYEREVNRVKLAILQLSERKTEKLPYRIKTAKVDYRDPLAVQELGSLLPAEEAKLPAAAKTLIDCWGKK